MPCVDINQVIFKVNYTSGGVARSACESLIVLQCKMRFAESWPRDPVSRNSRPSFLGKQSRCNDIVKIFSGDMP